MLRLTDDHQLDRALRVRDRVYAALHEGLRPT
jgi:hypothetical protein